MSPSAAKSDRGRLGDSRPCVHCGWATTVHAGVARGASEEGAAHAEGDASGPFCCLGCELAFHLSGRGLAAERSDRLLARILVSAFLAMGVMVFSLAGYGALFSGGDGTERASEAARALAGVQRMAALVLTLPIVHLLGVPLAAAVARGRRWLSADGLIVLGATAAFAASLWTTVTGHGHAYYETVAMVLVLVGLGRWLDARAKERARSDLSRAAEQAVPVARRLEGHGGERREVELAPELVRVGDVVRVRPGEPIPVDGRVVAGRAFVDTSSLTGESEPRSVEAGMDVHAGTVPADGFLDVEARAVVGERLRDGVERVLQEALANRGRHARLADRLAGVLVPLVGVGAAATFAFHALRGPWDTALLNALSFVLISCPCALGIATPLAFWTALSAAWRRGILVRGSDVLERLAQARRVDFDKTGTLTLPRLELVRFEATADLARDEVLALAAALEAGSEHPIAAAVRRAHGRAATDAARDFEVLPGRGVRGRVGERHLELSTDGGDPAEPFTVIALRSLDGDGQTLGRFALGSQLDPEARAVVGTLRLMDLDLRVLTGDSEGPAQWIARELALPVEFGLDPSAKVARIRAAGERGSVFVGDGWNDTAALAAAETGVAVAGASPRSVEVADATLLACGLDGLPDLLRLARRAVGTARANLAWAFGYNVVGWSLAATGRLTPVFAAAAMVLSSAAVVVHSGRAGRLPGRPTPTRNTELVKVPGREAVQAGGAARASS